MKASILTDNKQQRIDFSKPLDISIPLSASAKNPKAWLQGRPKIEPVVMDEWIGKVSEGASINFNDIHFNPHAHGTHTECVGHITEDFRSVNTSLKRFFYLAEVITVAPEYKKGDMVISRAQLKSILKKRSPEALVIRTLPNTASKKRQNHSNTNWPYLEKSAARFIRELGVKHLLIDQPSVDKEQDKGKLLAHREFWNYPESPRDDATITEMIYVSNRIKDGLYVLDLQMAPFVNDAAPSRPVLYKLTDE